MHLFAAIRGNINAVNQFITELQGKYLPFKWRDSPDKPFQDMSVQLNIQPIQLYSFVFPESSKDLVLSTILGQSVPNKISGSTIIKEDKGAGKPNNPRYKKFVWMLRKLLKLEPIPKYDETKIMPITKNSMEIVGIGIKKDGLDKNGNEGL